MTTWTSISNAAVAVGGIPSSSTVTALRDNPSAIAEAASGAPIVVSGWHPIDKVTIGDGKTGLIYDWAINGTVANVTTPDFEDGWEYRIVGHMLTSSFLGTVRLQVSAFFEIDAVYRRLAFGTDTANNASFGCDVVIPMPRLATQVHPVLGDMFVNNAVAMAFDAPYDATIQKLTRARISFTSGNINSGKVYLFRRREYASLP
jgi:hypothetical protein